MPSFVHPSLLWGLALVGLPILIHLINLLRQRRVEWAAMEFLLESQKKHRTWIIFKQLLLLLMRMAALAAIVLMLSQPLLRNEWSQVFGDGETHHIILIDDSYSMSDQGSNKSAFDQAKSVFLRLASEAAQQSTPQRMTVLRFSQTTSDGTHPDLTFERLDTQSVLELEKRVEEWTVSHTSAEPDAAIESLDSLTRSTDTARRVVYVLSDFRERQWADRPQLASALKKLGKSAQIKLINCTDDLRANRTISRLAPLPATYAAGVPLQAEVEVTNYSSLPAENVEIQIEIDDIAYERDLLIPRIDPFSSASVRFAFKRDSPGAHRIVARLDDDAIEIDNRRAAVVHLAESVPALILSQSADDADIEAVLSALDPGGTVRVGIDPRVERPRFLRDKSAAELRQFKAIYLVNLPQLDEQEIEALETYAASGGGVAFFLGESILPEMFNAMMYRDGEGLFPLPVSRARPLAIDRLETAPDVQTTDHPIVAVLSSERNPYVATVGILQYIATFESWKPDKNSQVIAELRNGAPLIVLQRFGAGRVAAIMTKASSAETRDLGAWNNWQRNPSFVVMLQQMQAFLNPDTHVATSHTVDQPISIELDSLQHEPKLEVRWPSDERLSDNDASRSIEIEAEPSAENPEMLVGQIGTTDDGAGGTRTNASGFYTVNKKRVDGEAEATPIAVNVDPEEGDLRSLDAAQLATEMPDVEYTYHQSGAFVADDDALPGTNLGPWLLYALIAVLVAEQLLAYSASYHAGSQEGMR